MRHGKLFKMLFDVEVSEKCNVHKLQHNMSKFWHNKFEHVNVCAVVSESEHLADTVSNQQAVDEVGEKHQYEDISGIQHVDQQINNPPIPANKIFITHIAEKQQCKDIGVIQQVDQKINNPPIPADKSDSSVIQQVDQQINNPLIPKDEVLVATVATALPQNLSVAESSSIAAAKWQARLQPHNGYIEIVHQPQRIPYIVLRSSNEKIAKFLQRFNFKQIQSDNCVYVAVINKCKVYVALCVNYGLVICKGQIANGSVLRNFECIVVQIKRDRDKSEIKISQSFYIKKYCNKFEVQNAKFVSVSAKHGIYYIIGFDVSKINCKRVTYRKLVSFILFVNRVCSSDIEYAANYAGKV